MGLFYWGLCTETQKVEGRAGRIKKVEGRTELGRANVLPGVKVYSSNTSTWEAEAGGKPRRPSLNPMLPLSPQKSGLCPYHLE